MSTFNVNFDALFVDICALRIECCFGKFKFATISRPKLLGCVLNFQCCDSGNIPNLM